MKVLSFDEIATFFADPPTKKFKADEKMYHISKTR